MPTEVEGTLEILIEAVRRQCDNYRSLGEAAREFGALLGAQEVSSTLVESLTGDTAFQEILARQAQWAEEVERVGAKIVEIRQRLGAELGIEKVTLSAIRMALEGRGMLDSCRSQLEVLDRAIAEVIVLARQVKEQTEANERLLRAGLRAVEGQLGNLKVGREVARAYGRMAKGVVLPAKFLDRKS